MACINNLAGAGVFLGGENGWGAGSLAPWRHVGTCVLRDCWPADSATVSGCEWCAGTRAWHWVHVALAGALAALRLRSGQSCACQHARSG
eukprot:8863125-Pyramimonas_sp.AAC.1